MAISKLYRVGYVQYSYFKPGAAELGGHLPTQFSAKVPTGGHLPTQFSAKVPKYTLPAYEF